MAHKVMPDEAEARLIMAQSLRTFEDYMVAIVRMALDDRSLLKQRHVEVARDKVINDITEWVKR